MGGVRICLELSEGLVRKLSTIMEGSLEHSKVSILLIRVVLLLFYGEEDLEPFRVPEVNVTLRFKEMLILFEESREVEDLNCFVVLYWANESLIYPFVNIDSS